MYLLIFRPTLLQLGYKIEEIYNSINNNLALNANIKEHNIFGRYIYITSNLYTDKAVSNVISELAKEYSLDSKDFYLIKELSENKCIGT